MVKKRLKFHSVSSQEVAAGDDAAIRGTVVCRQVSPYLSEQAPAVWVNKYLKSLEPANFFRLFPPNLVEPDLCLGLKHFLIVSNLPLEAQEPASQGV